MQCTGIFCTECESEVKDRKHLSWNVHDQQTEVLDGLPVQNEANRMDENYIDKIARKNLMEGVVSHPNLKQSRKNGWELYGQNRFEKLFKGKEGRITGY